MESYRSAGDLAANNPAAYEELTIDCPCCYHGDGLDPDDGVTPCRCCGGIGVIPDDRPPEPEPTDAEIEEMAQQAADLLEPVEF